MFPLSKKSYILFSIVTLGIVALFLKFRSCDRQKDVNNETTTLAPNESEKIIVDPVRHKITVVTREHVKTLTLPDRPSSISLLKHDGVKINSPQFGTEIRPFLGAAYTLEGGKLVGGVEVFYWKSLDAGLGISVNPKLVQDTRCVFNIAYMIYSNSSIFLGLDNHTVPMVGVRVRL